MKYILELLVTVVALTLSGIVMASPVGHELVLVENGKPKATLILAKNPRQVVKIAAQEFQNYVEKMTGCRFPEATDEDNVAGFKIFIGESLRTKALGFKNSDFKKDESLIKTGSDYLLIMGRDHDSYGPVSYEDGSPFYAEFNLSHDVGTFYGVHDFLENECGIRWYMPSEIGEVVPKNKSIIIHKINTKSCPWSTHREIRNTLFPKSLYWWDTTQYPKTSDLIGHWSQDGIIRWYLRMKVKNEPCYAGGHAAEAFYQRFYKTNPEYFAQGYPNSNLLQPCYTNPDVVRETVKMAREYFDMSLEEQQQKFGEFHAVGDYFPLGPCDFENWCKCPRCQSLLDQNKSGSFWNGSASRYVWQFVNNVAQEVKKTHPNKWIACLAYWSYALPPEGLQLQPNVAVSFCRPLACEWVPGDKINFDKSMLTWSQLAKKVYLYEYFCFPETSGNFKVFPFFAPHRIAEDMRLLKQAGFNGAYNDIAIATNQEKETFWPNPVMDQINFYVWLKYLDDADRNVDELLDEFYNSYYGPAGKHIKAFVTKAEAIYADPLNYTDLIKKSSGHLDEKTSWEKMCPPETLKNFGRLINAAYASAETPIHKKTR